MEYGGTAQAYSFEFSRSEHVRACRAIHHHSIHRRWVRRLLRVGYALLGIVVIVNMVADFRRGLFPAMLPLFVALAVWPFVVVLSGYAQPIDVAKSKEAGYLAHLCKPVSLPQLDEGMLKVFEKG